jgi:glycogen debranching enzyme
VIEPIGVLAHGVLLGYSSQEGMRRQTHITFEPRPEHVEIVNPTPRQVIRKEGERIDQRDEGTLVPPMASAVVQLDLPPMAGRCVTIDATPHAEYPEPAKSHVLGVAPAERVVRSDSALDELRRSHARWCAEATSIETSHTGFNEFISRALLDLHLLVEVFEGDLVPTAGIPWFAVPFGRDSLITSMQTLSLRPDLARGTLRFLSRHQGQRVDESRGEEPGKILHEMRPGEFGGGEQGIYYGSTDSTPLFIVAMGEYLAWTADTSLARELLPNLEAALAWMDNFGDVDNDGFIEMNRYPAVGLGSQGWKDSPDAITHRDGERAKAPIALAEFQAYRFAAHDHMARLYGRLGETDKQRRQQAAAERMRVLFVEQLAMDTDCGPYWALGLDAAKNKIESVTTNPGHALWAGLLRGQQARLTTERLLAEDMLSGWGLRTLSSSSVKYNPMSYHNGAVWPHDSAIVALGMKRSGHDAAAHRLTTEVLEAALHFPGSRLPELWCGFSRAHGEDSMPAQYPVGCSPQAWAAGSAFMLLQALLGLEADAAEGVIRLRPVLPAWLNAIRYKHLRVGDRYVDFEVERINGKTAIDVRRTDGLRVEASLPTT